MAAAGDASRLTLTPSQRQLTAEPRDSVPSLSLGEMQHARHVRHSADDARR
jgi:hypothetical protein